MSFFDKVKGALNSGREELTRQVGRFKNKKFMQGTVAVCARIAAASDGVSSEEKQKMMGFLRASEELKIFDTNEVIEFFNKLVSSFDFDVEIGKGETMKYILEPHNWHYALVLLLAKATATLTRMRKQPHVKSLSRSALTRLNSASEIHPLKVNYGFDTYWFSG